MATVIDRVDRLEEALEHFITSVGAEFNRRYHSQTGNSFPNTGNCR